MADGRLNYRPYRMGFLATCGLTKCTFPDWMTDLAGKSGVYVIRSPGGTVRYVGESHTGRLKKTLLRHFQSWTGKTSGPTYSGAVEVAILVTAAVRAVARQNELIKRLDPRDNRRPVGENPF